MEGVLSKYTLLLLVLHIIPYTFLIMNNCMFFFLSPCVTGAGKDVFKYDRAVGDPEEAHLSNFLHPVIYHYKHLPTGQYI